MPDERLSNVDKAFALARLGLKVFPVASSTRRPLIAAKEGGTGFYDATSDDAEQINTWFGGEFPEASTEVGVWMGGSGLIAADLDRGKKNGKDGFASLVAAGRAVSETHFYATKSGGEHHIWEAGERLDLAPGADVLGMEGVDIRAGGSYIVWWGDDVPTTREAFSTEVPDWVLDAATPAESDFDGEGFSGSVEAWLEAIPDGKTASTKVNDFVARIPSGKFGHPEMIELAWALVRMGSERETGIKNALDALKSAWLRDPYNTAQYRRDFDLALKGAINKGGRVQLASPMAETGSLSSLLAKADKYGISDDLKSLEKKSKKVMVDAAKRAFEGSPVQTEGELARLRREMFKVAAEAGVPASLALGVVSKTAAFENSIVPIDSVWYGDGEPVYHDKVNEAEEEAEAETQAALEKIEQDVEAAKRVATLSAEAEANTFLTPNEKKIAETYDWWGNDYLAWVQTRLKHFNKPYHVGAMWAALSVMVSPWGRLPLQGHKPTGCNLYFNILGESSSGKSEAWGFATGMINEYYGTDPSAIVADAKKTTALALHRTLILRHKEASLVFSDEVQSFFKDIQSTHWQGTILGDLSDYYGGTVPPKNTMNDKEISGKTAETLLTVYFTGISDLTLDALSISNWRDGFLYRYLWGFGEPRAVTDYEIAMETTGASYTTPLTDWAHEFIKKREFQKLKWGEGRIVQWEPTALKRMEAFKKQIDEAVKSSSLYDTVFIPANGRFLTSIMKAATLVALATDSEKVTLEHALVAINSAGPWHKSMVLAVAETGKDLFERDVEKALVWIKRNAIRQVGKVPVIQRSQVMREFKPNETADRLLRQLTEEGRLIRGGDTYQLSEG